MVMTTTRTKRGEGTDNDNWEQMTPARRQGRATMREDDGMDRTNKGTTMVQMKMGMRGRASRTGGQ
jgi:hypothetical protein